jgi:hypothetical protein
MQRRLASTSPQRGLLDPPAERNEQQHDHFVNNKQSKGRERGRPSGVEDNKILKNIVTFIQGPVHDFFHARTGPKGCRLVGYIRVCYALLFLYSMLLMTIQLNTLLGPRKGLMSYAITGENHYRPEAVDNRWNVFRLAPESSVMLYLLFLFGLGSGVFLLLGIQPRWAAVGTYVFLHNLRAQNNFIWDHEAHMVRLWAFFLIFLPLDHITINDGFGGLVPLVRRRLNIMRNNNNISAMSYATTTHQQQQPTESWAMWPFRLWQVYTCLIYVGAGLCKFNTTPWQRGFALAYCWYDEGVGRFYPSFMIELMYNRMIAIKIQTYMSLVIENLCYITIWPLKTRKWTFIAIVLLHIGIELALLMHIFEYLSVLGWVVFFAYPNDGKPADDTTVTDLVFGNEKIDKPRTSPIVSVKHAFTGLTKSPEKRKTIIHSIVAGTILYLLVFDIFPRNSVEKLLPTSITYLLKTFVYPSRFTKRAAMKLSLASGIRSGPFLLFGGLPPHSQNRITAVVRFNDGKEPALFKYDDWSEQNILQNEIDYWYDTYLYYMLESSSKVALYSAFSVHVAELYSNGGVSREYSDVMIDPNKNTVESVSVQVHTKTGRHSPFSMLSNFESIPRGWDYESECRFVLDFEEIQLEDKIRYVGMNSLWMADVNDDGDDDGDDDGVAQKDGCTNYNRADEFLHRKGGYVEAAEEGGDDGLRVSNINKKNGYERRPLQGMGGQRQQQRVRRAIPDNESGDDDGSDNDDEKDDEGNNKKIVYKIPIRSGGGGDDDGDDDGDDGDDGGDRRHRRRLGAGTGTGAF